jgi:hypothetical protein
MNDIILPQEEDYRAEIRVVIRETQQAIREALGYIERQEDGPLTMRHALKDIDQNVTAIECEVSYLTGELQRLRLIASTLLKQRDEAVRQRDLLIALCGLPEYGEPLT